MIHKLLLPIISTLLLGLQACVPNDNTVDAPSLKLEKESLTIANSGGEVSLGIATNQLTITAFATEGWAQASVSGKTVTVKVEPNTKGVDRITDVVVGAGGVIQTAKLTQSAAEMVLDTDSEEIFFPVNGGTRSLSLSSNTGKWTVKLSAQPQGDEEWLTITEVPDFNKVILTASPNDGPAPRKMELIASNGGTPKVIPVKQDAKGMYILPMDPSLGGLRQIVLFESARGSITDPLEALPSFWTQYDKMNRIVYEIDVDGDHTDPDNRYTQALIDCPDKEVIFCDAYKDFMKEKGFELLSATESRMTFVSESMHLEAEALTRESIDFAGVLFKPYVKQPKEYKTFKTLPLEPINEMILKNATYDDVQKYEQKHGGKFRRDKKSKEGLLEAVEYLVTGQTPNIVARGWFFYADKKKLPKGKELGQTHQCLLCYEDYTLMYWNNGTADEPEYHMTKEFRNLLKSQGFEDSGQQDRLGFSFWVNAETDVVILPRVIQFYDLMPEKSLGVINMWIEKVGTASGVLPDIKGVPQDLSPKNK